MGAFDIAAVARMPIYLVIEDQCDLKKWLGGGGDGASAVVHDVYKGPCGGKKV